MSENPATYVCVCGKPADYFLRTEPSTFGTPSFAACVEHTTAALDHMLDGKAIATIELMRVTGQ